MIPVVMPGFVLNVTFNVTALLVFKVLNHFLKTKTHSGKIGFKDHGISQSFTDPFFDLSGNAEIIQVFLIFDIVKYFFDQGYHLSCG